MAADGGSFRGGPVQRGGPGGVQERGGRGRYHNHGRKYQPRGRGYRRQNNRPFISDSDSDIYSYDEPDLEYDYEDLVPESPTDLDGLGAHGGVPAQGPPGAHGYDRIEWELLGTGPYEARNGFGGVAPFRGRGYPGAPPPPRWQHQHQHQHGFHRPRARGHNNYGRNDYNNFRGQNQARSRPRPFVRLSNRGGRYYFNERQGFEQGQGRSRGRARGHTQGNRGRGRGANLSYSPSSGSDSDEETEYQKKIQGMVDTVDDNIICEVFQEMIIGKNIDSARRFLTWGLKHGTSRLALELLMRKHRRQTVLKRSQATPSTNAANDVLPSSADSANQASGSSDSRAAQALTEFYNILQKIFSFLPAKELNKFARVCKEWKRVADLVKKSRDQQMLGLYYGWHLNKTIDQMIADPIEGMPFEAQFALISNTDSLQYGGLASAKVKLWSSAFIHNRSDPLCYLDDYLEVLLPVNCRIHGFTGARIVGTTCESSTHDAGKCDDNAKVAWCLLFPKSPKLRIYDFALTDEEVKSLVKEYSPTDPKAQLDKDLLNRLTRIPNEEDVKLLITFYSGMFISTHNGAGSILPDFVDNFIHGLLRKSPQMSLCGGGADELLPEDEIALKEMLVDGSEYELKCIALCGPGIRTATVVIDSETDEQDEVLQQKLIVQLEKLKGTGFDCRNAVALVFSSLGSKGYKPMELMPTTKAFLTVFPDVPLYGAYCNNPYGYNFLPNFLSKDKTEFTVIGEHQSEAGEALVDLPTLHGGVSFNNPSPLRTVYTLLSLK